MTSLEKIEKMEKLLVVSGEEFNFEGEGVFDVLAAATAAPVGAARRVGAYLEADYVRFVGFEEALCSAFSTTFEIVEKVDAAGGVNNLDWSTTPVEVVDTDKETLKEFLAFWRWALPQL